MFSAIKTVFVIQGIFTQAMT